MCINDTTHELQPNDRNADAWNNPTDIVAFCVGILSMLGSFLILASFLLVKDLRSTTSRRVLCFISIADLGACLSQVIGAGVYFGSRTGCDIQGIFTVFFSLSFILWTTCMALYLYISLVSDNLAGAKKMVNWFHPIGWGLPLTVALLSYFYGALGSDESLATVGWCWVSVVPKVPPATWKCREAILLWMMVTMKFWELISYILVPALYFFIKRHLRRVTTIGSNEIQTTAYRKAVRSIDRKLVVLPVAYILLRVWGTIRMFLFLFDYYYVYKPSTVLVFKISAYMQALGDNAQGAVNFVLFVLLTTKVRSSFISYLCRLCRCCSSPCRPENDADEKSESRVQYQTFGNDGQPSEDTIELSDSRDFGRYSSNNGGHTSAPLLGTSDQHLRQQVRRWFHDAQQRMENFTATPHPS